MTDDVHLQTNERVATIVVDRPKRHNAMDIAVRKQLRRAFETAADDESVRVIVLRGAGEDAFITGGDIETLHESDLLDGLEYATKYAQGLYNYIARVSKPTIAAIDGYALGGGLEIAAACDIRLATTGAKLGVPEVTLGVIPGGGGTQRLQAIVGTGVARELVFTGKVIDAEEARELHLINHVYERNEFDTAVIEMAEQIADNAPVAIRLAKEAMNRGLDLEAGLDFERVAFAVTTGTADKNEGTTAFLSNRSADFEGE
jgi:enoyl-CoA hydratase